MSGEITDQLGNAATDFNGTIYPVVYDKVQDQLTLANDPTSQTVNFKVQKNLLFKGKARVQNGRFSFSFIVPRDIDYKFGNGRISYYAENGSLMEMECLQISSSVEPEQVVAMRMARN